MRLLLCLLVCFVLFISTSQAQDPTPTPDPLPQTPINCKDNTGQLTCTLSDPDDSTIDYSGWFLNGELLNFNEFVGNSVTFAISGCGDFQITARGVGTYSGGIQFRNANGATSFSRACPESSGQFSASAAIDMNLQIGQPNSQGITINSDTPGLQAKRVGALAVGIQEIVDAGIIAAVDLWGADDAEGEVCIPGSGRLLFKDTSTTPHQVSSLASYQRDGKTCAQVTGTGTVILVQDDSANRGGAGGQSQPAAQSTPTPASSSSPAWMTERNCCYHPDWNCPATDHNTWRRGYMTYHSTGSCDILDG